MMSRLNNRQKHALGWLFAITYFSGVAAMYSVPDPVCALTMGTPYQESYGERPYRFGADGGNGCGPHVV